MFKELKRALFKEIIDDMMISPQTDNINKETEIIKESNRNPAVENYNN